MQLPLKPLPETPLVSILVASYNYERFIKEAVESILSQMYQNLEIIVCDDGSDDNSCQMVSSMAASDDRIRLLRQENSGVAAALNSAFNASSGEIICLLDADDAFRKEKVGAVVKKMQSSQQPGFVQHAMSVVDVDGRTIRQLPAHGLFEEGWIADKIIARGGRWRNMPASALSFRREVAEVLFPMPAANLRSMADAYLYMLAPLLTPVGYLPAPLAVYRLHGTNLTGALHFDAEVSQKYTAGIKRVHACVREVVEARGLDLPALETSRHLSYLEHNFMQDLYGGKRRGYLLKQYRSLRKEIQKDDLYPFTRKLLGQVVLGVAIFLPAVIRSKWITWGMVR